jgi:leucyl aminopeptidase
MANVELSGAGLTEIETDLLAVFAFEDELAGGLKGPLLELDRKLDGHLGSAAKDERFAGRAEQTLLIHTLGRLPAARLLLLGLGPRAKAAALARAGFEPVRMAAGKAARAAARASASRLAVAVPAAFDAGAAGRAVVEGALLGAYRFDRYKTKKDEQASLGTLTVVVPRASARSAGAKQGVELGRRIAEAVAWARDLVNEAPVDLTPSQLARAAQEMAKEAHLKCEVQGPKEIEALKMGMFLGVTRGSAEEPRLVKVSWIPKSAPRGKALVLVGKAITFDSGGLSLKTTEGMVTMNGDMAGSAAVLAAMKIVAALQPPFAVHALLGACENMPGGRAYKPSDVLTAYNGKTVEITNTDAEGRLVLGDVLAWGIDKLDPAAIVDVATLTGACVVALGSYTVGAFGPDGPAIEAVLAAARAAGEDFWRMPLVPPVKDTLKSDVADLRNTGERWGGAIAAAHFLSEFTSDVPWAHLDIAGPSHSSKERGYIGKGGTGVAVRTLVELVRAWKPPKVKVAPEAAPKAKPAAKAGKAQPRRATA